MSKLTPESHATSQTERPLTAQRLAQYVARGRCERHMGFTLFPSEAREMLGRYRLEFEPLSPLLSGEGQRFEREMIEELAARAAVRDMSNTGPEAFISGVAAQGEARVCYYQPTLRGHGGAPRPLARPSACGLREARARRVGHKDGARSRVADGVRRGRDESDRRE